MQGRPSAEMEIVFAASRCLLAVLLVASASLASEPAFVVVTRPLKVKISYGETVLPAGTKLQAVSIDDPVNVQVIFMEQVLTIPKDAVQFESGPTPSPSPMNSPPPPIQQPPCRPTFGWRWEPPPQGGNITMRELQKLLSPHCTPLLDLGGCGINIYNGVGYLMDSRQAASVLGLHGSIPSSVPLATSGFPNGCYYIAFDGRFEEHFNRVYLVTDAANQVVCIQLVDEHPRFGGMPGGNWVTYNFINMRLRASPSVSVSDESNREDDVIHIETRMGQQGKEMENAKLLIPIPFARIILHCIQIGLSKP